MCKYCRNRNKIVKLYPEDLDTYSIEGEYKDYYKNLLSPATFCPKRKCNLFIGPKGKIYSYSLGDCEGRDVWGPSFSGTKFKYCPFCGKEL